MNLVKQHPKLAVAIGISAVGFIKRIKSFSSDFHPWTDELEQINGLSHTLPDLLGGYLSRIAGGFPGDYLLTWPFAHLSNNKWVIAFPHIITCLLGFFLFYHLLKDKVQTVAGYFAAFLIFSLNKGMVFHAFEIRPYGTITTMALFVFLCIYEYFKGTNLVKPMAWPCWVFVVLLFHAYGVLMLGAFSLFHLFVAWRNEEMKSRIKRYLLLTIIGGLVSLPLWFYFTAPAAGTKFGTYVFEYSGRTPWSIFKFLVGNLGNISLPGTGMLTVPFVLIAIFAGLKIDVERLAYFLLVIALPLLLIFINDYKSDYWFVQRQFVWLVPFWAILVGQGVDRIVQRRFI